MLGGKIEIPFLKRNDAIPGYFDEGEVERIFQACRNVKHLAMLNVLSMGVCGPLSYVTWTANHCPGNGGHELYCAFARGHFTGSWGIAVSLVSRRASLANITAIPS